MKKTTKKILRTIAWILVICAIDSLSYGIGIGIPEWRRQYGKKVVKASVTTESGLGTETKNMNQFFVIS